MMKKKILALLCLWFVVHEASIVTDGLTDEKRDEFELNEQTVYFKEKEVILAWKELETVQS